MFKSVCVVVYSRESSCVSIRRVLKCDFRSHLNLMAYVINDQKSGSSGERKVKYRAFILQCELCSNSCKGSRREGPRCGGPRGCLKVGVVIY